MDALDPASRSVLAEGRQLHVGVLTTRGPHVTPELYTGDERQIWFLTAADTVKTRVVRRDPRVAAAVRVGSRSVLVAGAVTEYDVHAPLTLLARSRDALAALAALTSYTVRNAADLAAFARDLAAGRLPSRLPPRRVLMRLRPDRAMLLDGPALLAAHGAWSGPATTTDTSAAAAGDMDCVVGVETDDGVLVAPGRARDSLEAATIPAAAVQRAGAAVDRDVRGCLVVDDYRAPGPAAKRGQLLRGTVRLEPDGAWCAVRLDADRDTTWTGARTTTAHR